MGVMKILKTYAYAQNRIVKINFSINVKILILNKLKLVSKQVIIENSPN